MNLTQDGALHEQDRLSKTDIVSPLRQRMIEDMAARKLNPHTQRSHIYSCKRFAAWLKRSPDTATADEVRRFQLHLIESGASICNRNRIVTGVRFLFRVTLRRHDLAAEIWHLKEPQKLPPVLSPEEVKRAASTTPAELDDRTVAGALNDAAMMSGAGGVYQVAAEAPKARERALLVCAGQPAVADDVGHQNRRELAGFRHGGPSGAMQSSTENRPEPPPLSRAWPLSNDRFLREANGPS